MTVYIRKAGGPKRKSQNRHCSRRMLRHFLSLSISQKPIELTYLLLYNVYVILKKRYKRINGLRISAGIVSSCDILSFFYFWQMPDLPFISSIPLSAKKKTHQKLTVGQSTAQSCLYYLNIYDILATCSSTLIREKK